MDDFALADELVKLVPLGEGDTRADGLKYCPECGEPLELAIELLGKARIVPIGCRCMRDKWEEEKRTRRTEDAGIRARAYIARGVGSIWNPKHNFDADDAQDQHAAQVCKKYAEHFADLAAQNIGLLLCGEIGSGKTFYAECIANSLKGQGLSIVYTTIEQLANALNQDEGRYQAEVMRVIKQADLLILDDFGAERDTSYMQAQCYAIINARYNAQKPLIVTTNLTRRQMEENFQDKRVKDRLLEMCIQTEVKCSRRRRALAASKLEEAKKLLGI